MRTSAPRTKPVEYPESDGKPMAESDLHRDWMICIIQRLKRFFAGRRVYVSGNLLVYHVEGDPKKSFAPDAFVVKNCDPRRRKIFKMWEEGRRPCFVLETTSPKTQREDKGKKMQLYAQLGVPDYFLYDPLAEWLKPALQGYRLIGGEYQPIEPDAAGGIRSAELGITFRLEKGDLAMFETATGERLQSDAEASANLEARVVKAEEAAGEAARAAADAAKVAARAVKEVAKANAQARQAVESLEQEIAARKALEEELARLRARDHK